MDLGSLLRWAGDLYDAAVAVRDAHDRREVSKRQLENLAQMGKIPGVPCLAGAEAVISANLDEYSEAVVVACREYTSLLAKGQSGLSGFENDAGVSALPQDWYEARERASAIVRIEGKGERMEGKVKHPRGRRIFKMTD